MHCVSSTQAASYALIVVISCVFTHSVLEPMLHRALAVGHLTNPSLCKEQFVDGLFSSAQLSFR